MDDDNTILLSIPPHFTVSGGPVGPLPLVAEMAVGPAPMQMFWVFRHHTYLGHGLSVYVLTAVAGSPPYHNVARNGNINLTIILHLCTGSTQASPPACRVGNSEP